MSVRILRLGTQRARDEGIRIGTVRRPPRGVPKSEFALRDFYDVWLPILSPSVELVAFAKAADGSAAWRAFKKKFKSEMSGRDPSHVLDLLAALSHRTNFSLGCYCQDEAHCHRGVLRELLALRGADLRDDRT